MGKLLSIPIFYFITIWENYLYGIILGMEQVWRYGVIVNFENKKRYAGSLVPIFRTCGLVTWPSNRFKNHYINPKNGMLVVFELFRTCGLVTWASNRFITIGLVYRFDFTFY